MCSLQESLDKKTFQHQILRSESSIHEASEEIENLTRTVMENLEEEDYNAEIMTHAFSRIFPANFDELSGFFGRKLLITFSASAVYVIDANDLNSIEYFKVKSGFILDIYMDDAFANVIYVKDSKNLIKKFQICSESQPLLQEDKELADLLISSVSWFFPT